MPIRLYIAPNPTDEIGSNRIRSTPASTGLSAIGSYGGRRKSSPETALPLELYEAAVRETLPRATFTVLPDVAHVPMLDDPGLVAHTILAVTGAAKG